MAATQLRGGQLKNDTITNTQISPSAAIALSKLAEAVIQADGGQAFTATQSMGGFVLSNLGAPSADNDAARKADVDAAKRGLDVKDSVKLATNAALPSNTGSAGVLTASANGVLTVDGIATVLNDRILVKNEATGSNNGIYYVSTEGTAGVAYVLTRATDADVSAEVTSGMYTFADQGTANADTSWVLTTNDPITLNTTALTFSKFSSTGGLTEARMVTRETPGGTINGSNTAFTIANALVAGTEELYLNGVLQQSGSGNDYTISGTSITYATAPATNDTLLVSYIKS